MRTERKKLIQVVGLGFRRQPSPDGPRPAAVCMLVCRRQMDNPGLRSDWGAFFSMFTEQVKPVVGGKKERNSLELMKELNEDQVLEPAALLLQLIMPLPPGRASSGQEKTGTRRYFVAEYWTNPLVEYWTFPFLEHVIHLNRSYWSLKTSLKHLPFSDTFTSGSHQTLGPTPLQHGPPGSKSFIRMPVSLTSDHMSCHLFPFSKQSAWQRAGRFSGLRDKLIHIWRNHWANNI